MNRDTLSDHGYRLPPEIISHAVWLSHRFGVSVRAVEDLLPGPMRPHGVLRSDPAHAQRFLSVHGLVLNLFQVGRHLLRSAHHRLLRRRAFAEWDAVTCVC